MTTTIINRISIQNNCLTALIDPYRIESRRVEADRTATQEPIDVYSHVLTREQLTHEIVSSLAFLRKPPSRFTTCPSIHNGYDVALEKLQAWRAEASEFFAELIRSTIQFENFDRYFDVRDKGAQAAFDLLGEFGHFSAESLRTPRSLQLAGQTDKSLIYDIYSEHLRRSIDLFVESLMSHFEKMAERGVVGSAQYVGQGLNKHCQFTSFSSRVILTVTDVSNTIERQHTSNLHHVAGDWYRTKTTITQLRTSGIVLVQHVHAATLLGDVASGRLANCAPSRMPVRIIQLLDKIPSFLRDHTYFTDGQQRERIEVAKDVKEVPWSYLKEELAREEVRHADPFIAVGPFVIAYWCDKETTELGQLPSAKTYRTRLFGSFQVK